MNTRSKTRHTIPWPSIVSLYLAGMLQGLILVSFPASSAVLKQMHGLSDAQYGAIFLPQVVLAVIGALGGGALASRLGLKPLLGVALLINVTAMLVVLVAEHPSGHEIDGEADASDPDRFIESDGERLEELDHLPEEAFYMHGAIEEVLRAADAGSEAA